MIEEKYLEKIQDFQWFWLMRVLAKNICEEYLDIYHEFEDEIPFEINGELGITVKTKTNGKMAWLKNDLIKRFAIKDNERERIIL